MRADPKKAKREAIARQTEQFMARGGSVTQVPEGQRAIPEFAYRLALLDGETIRERNARYKKPNRNRRYKTRSVYDKRS
jgi:hypothetical protein